MIEQPSRSGDEEHDAFAQPRLLFLFVLAANQGAAHHPVVASRELLGAAQHLRRELSGGDHHQRPRAVLARAPRLHAPERRQQRAHVRQGLAASRLGADEHVVAAQDVRNGELLRARRAREPQLGVS